MSTKKFEVKDCCLYIHGREVRCEDDLVRLAGLLATGSVPDYIDVYDLEDDELLQIEEVLSKEIFFKGDCLTPDENPDE